MRLAVECQKESIAVRVVQARDLVERGFSTIRMLVGMCLLASLLPILPRTASAQARPDDFGRRWVRSHPFTLMALVFQNEALDENNRFAAAGLNTILAWDPWMSRPGIFKSANRAKLPWHYHIDERTGDLEAVKAHISQLLATHPGAQGLLAWDEPKLPDMPLVAERVAWIKKAYPDLLVYSNVNPPKPPYESSFPTLAGEKHLGDGIFDEPSVPYTYDDHLDNLAKIVQSDVLMADIYPFWAPKTMSPEKFLRNSYFFALTALRKAGLKHNRPYWMFVQSYEDTQRCRYPSESDVRMQVYSGLAFGFTGFAFFTFDSSPPFARGILNHDFSPAALYEPLRKLNAEVSRLGKVLRFLTSTDIRYLQGSRAERGTLTKNILPRSMVAFDPRSRVAKEVRDAVFQGSGQHNDGLIGFFQDDRGGKYVMVVNLQHGEGKSADEMKASIALTFDPSVSAVYRLSRETGKAEAVSIVDGKLNLELPGGTGELLKLGDDRFPGL